MKQRNGRDSLRQYQRVSKEDRWKTKEQEEDRACRREEEEEEEEKEEEEEE